MLLIVILNVLLAVMIVSVIVALHTKAIRADLQHERRLSAAQPRPRTVTPTPEYWSAYRPTARATRRQVPAAS